MLYTLTGRILHTASLSAAVKVVKYGSQFVTGGRMVLVNASYKLASWHATSYASAKLAACRGNEAKELHTDVFIEQKLQYIHYNPVVAEIVAEPEHYLYSSAQNYAGQPGLLDVVLLE